MIQYTTGRMSAMTINKNEFIGKRIKEYRLKRKWTQQDLADRIGMKKNTVSAYEIGRVEIPHSKLQLVANAFEITTTDLLPEEKVDSITKELQEAKSKLSSDQLAFLELLIAKTNSLSLEERDNFLKNIKFAVKFFDEE